VISIKIHCLEAESLIDAIAARTDAAYVDSARKFCGSICSASRELPI
jgi:hypothetical protein